MVVAHYDDSMKEYGDMGWRSDSGGFWGTYMFLRFAE